MRQPEYPAEFLSSVHSGPRCSWCQHPDKKIYRKGLCSSCYRTSRKEAQLASAVEALKKNGRPVPFPLEFDLHTYAKMGELARGEGGAYGDIHQREITGLDLEWELSYVSKRFVKKDLFHGDANLFDWSFTPDQKRLLYYLLSKMSRAYLRRGRKNRAANSSDRWPMTA
jgi:hypothetical protein